MMIILLALPDLATEDRLLAQARRGDQMAIMRLYDAFFTPVYQYIRLRVGDAMTAEDLTSDVFLKMVAALRGPAAPRQSLRGWLFRVARNAIIDHSGAHHAMANETLDEWVADSTDQQPEFSFMRNASEQRAQNAVRMLAPEQQEVLVLRFGQQLSLQETADVMGKSLSAVKSLQWRAVETLRGILGSADGERSA